MRVAKDLSHENDCFCYGGFSERWKYDAYVKRKNWFKRNKYKMIAVCASVAAAIAVTMFFVLK